MLIIEVHDMKNEETSNNGDGNSEVVYSATATYFLADTVQYNGFIWYSTTNGNQGNTPSSSPLEWTIVSSLNKLNLYDVYPNTFTTKTNATLTLSYNVTNIDTIFLGNIHGSNVSVTVGGTTYTKNISTPSVSPITVWSLEGLVEMDDFYIEIPNYSGTITINVAKATSDNNASIGFVNYGTRASVGCTILDAIRYNVRSGVKMTGTTSGFNRVRGKGWAEIILPIKISDTKRTKEIISLLSKYNGVPILIVGDDLGIREETIFYGVFTEIEAVLSERNRYTISLRSLDYRAFVPPTFIEEKQEEEKQAQEEAGGQQEKAKIDIHNGVPTCADFTDAVVLYDGQNLQKKYMCDGTDTWEITNRVDHLPTVPTILDFMEGTGRDIIFNGCDVYRNNGGVVEKCETPPQVGTKAGVPTATDFSTGTDVIFNSSSMCDMYWNDGGTVRKCEAEVRGYTGVPPLVEFTTGGAFIVFDRTSPCDMYYNNGGVVEKCGGSSSCETDPFENISYVKPNKSTIKTTTGSVGFPLYHHAYCRYDGTGFSIEVTSSADAGGANTYQGVANSVDIGGLFYSDTLTPQTKSIPFDNLVAGGEYGIRLVSGGSTNTVTTVQILYGSTVISTTCC